MSGLGPEGVQPKFPPPVSIDNPASTKLAIADTACGSRKNGVSIYVLSDPSHQYKTSQDRQPSQRSRERNPLSYHRRSLDDSLAHVNAVKPSNAHIPATITVVESDIHNRRMFRGISERSITNPTRVLFRVASSNGLAPMSLGLTLTTAIMMSTPIRC